MRINQKEVGTLMQCATTKCTVAKNDIGKYLLQIPNFIKLRILLKYGKKQKHRISSNGVHA